MNRIVHQHYPVEKLPEDLRAELGVTGTATVTVEVDTIDNSQKRTNWDDLIAQVRQLHASGAIKPVTSEEAVARVRALRDEWD